MICGLCRWRGTRSNKSGLYCNKDKSGKQRILATNPACDCYDEDTQVFKALEQIQYLKGDNQQLLKLVVKQCQVITGAEKLALTHAHLYENVKRLLDIIDKCQVFEGTDMLVGPIPKLQEAHSRVRNVLKDEGMTYPTMEEIEHADRLQIARWSKYLPSPGSAAIGTPEFPKKLEEEGKIMDRIQAKLKKQGGMTPEISKEIGWG